MQKLSRWMEDLGCSHRILGLFRCYANRNSIMIPPSLGTFGTMGRNIFLIPVSGMWTFSWRRLAFRRALSRPVPGGVLQHFQTIPTLANPYGGRMVSASMILPWGFGCGCANSDVAAANPAVGSGGPRSVQLGLKLIFDRGEIS